MTPSSSIERLQTDIAGLDQILEGGLLRSAVYIVEGPPGAGKTILATQICFNGARRGERALYVTLLAESHERMLLHLSRMRFYDAALVPESVYFISAFRALQQDGLPALLRVLREAIIEREASILVLDGMVTAEEVSLSRSVAASAITQDAGSSQHFKQFIHELQSVCSMTGCTGILLSSTERPRLFHPAFTMVDGIVELTNELSRLKPIRQLHVRKMRGTDQILGRHNFEISDSGIKIHMRLESRLHTPGKIESPPGELLERVPTGLERLDQMLHGGLPHSSVTMLLGPTGTGKTLIALQFLAEGARRGEPGVYFGFFERPSALLRKSRRLGNELQDFFQRGLVEFVWQQPVEAVIDVLADRLFAAVQRVGAKRLVIDGIQGFELALDDYPHRIRGVFAALTDELERLGVTVIYTVETREVFGPTIEIPVTGVSAATQNIILLRHVELRDRLSLMLAVLKVRDSHFDRGLRELVISDSGVSLEDAPALEVSSTPARALRSRSSVLTPRRNQRPARKGKARAGKAGKHTR